VTSAYSQVLTSGSTAGRSVTSRTWVGPVADFGLVLVGGTCALLFGVIGLLVSSGIVFAGAKYHQPWVLIVAEVGAAYLLLGSVLVVRSATPAGHLSIPGPSNLATMASTTFSGWNGLLSTEPVVSDTGNLLVIPFLCAMAAAATAMGLARKAKHAWVAVIPLVTLLAVGILFGTSASPSRIMSGGALGLTILGWLAFRSRSQRVQGIGTASSTGVWRAAGVLLVACALGVLLAPAIPGSSAHLRYVLRDHVAVPFNALDYPSPLSAYREYVLPKSEGGLKTTQLLRVSGAPAGSYLRIATMDDYNGVVYNVAGGVPGSTASGNFSTVGAPVTQGRCYAQAPCRQATITVTDLHYANVWLPDVGTVRSVQFRGGQSGAQRNAFRYNTATDNAVLTSGLQPGDRYSMIVDVPSLVPATRMTQAQVAQVALPAPVNVPGAVHHDALTLTTKATTDFAKALALAHQLNTLGAYSDGITTQDPALSGHGAFRIQQFLSLPQPVGDAEQYATSMALMAQNLGLPARVVLGAKLPGGTSLVTGADITAWVEVKFTGVGWYVFSPTPPTTAKVRATPLPPSSSTSNQAQNPNPPAPNDGNGSVNTNAQTKSIHHPTTTPRALKILGEVLKVVGILLLALFVFLGPFVGIMWVKARRQKQRRNATRPSDRVAGGWREMVDHAVDRGTSVPRVATRNELAMVVGPTTVAIAERADLNTFGPAEPDAEEAEAFWELIDASLSELHQSMGAWESLKVRINPRSLVGDLAMAVVARRVTGQLSELVGTTAQRVRQAVRRNEKGQSA
jgi:hypothetical protein